MSVRCSTCSVTLNSQGQMDQHLMGKVHAKKLKQLFRKHQASGGQQSDPQSQGDQASQTTAQAASGSQDASLFCDLCMQGMNSEEQARIHYSGTKHMKKLKMMQRFQKATESSSSDPKTNHGMFYCSFCRVAANSVEQMDVHRSGSKHRKNVEEARRQQQGGLDCGGDSGEDDMGPPRAKVRRQENKDEIPMLPPPPLPPLPFLPPLRSDGDSSNNGHDNSSV